MNKSVHEVAEMVRGKVVGDGEVRITGLGGIAEAVDGDLTFLGSPRFLSHLQTTGAAAVLVPEHCVNGTKKPLIQVLDPYRAFTLMLSEIEAETLKHPTGIHPTAVVGKNVTLGKGVALDAHVTLSDGCNIGDGAILYAGVYVGRGASIGAGTVIYPNTTIREGVALGARCLIHNNASIGSDGFGFQSANGARAKVPQVGCVIVGDDVEIGANSSVDRATCGETRIGDGTKIDNLVQIGHNVKIGKHCTISGSSGIAGSATIGDHVTIGGMVGVGDHVEIGDNVMVGGRSGVTKSVEAGRVVSGFPVRDHDESRRIVAGQRRLPQALRKIRQLEERLKLLEQRLDG